MSVGGTKVGCTFGIVAISILGGILPIRFRTRLDPVMPFLSMLAGGVFFSLALMHLLPEALEGLEVYLQAHSLKPRINYGMLTLSFTFFLLLIVDLAASAIARNGKEEDKGILLLEDYDGSHHGGEEDHHHSVGSVAGTQGWVLLAALSLHSVFEGLSLGAQTTERGLLLLFAGIAVHKALEVFALCSAMLRQGTARGRVAKVMTMFIAITPIGTAIGAAIESRLHGLDALLASSILDALAAGAFLFVSTQEIIAHELSERHGRSKKIVCLLFGFGLTLGLKSLFPE